MRFLDFLLRRFRRDQRGASVVELAIVAPLLIMMTVAATDFARVFIEAHALASASGSGVSYGARRNIDSVNFTEIRKRALDDIQGAGNSSVATASMFCDCPDAPGTSVDCLSGSCPNYGQPRVYIKTSVQKTFATLGNYPWVPKSTNLKANAYMRVQ